nr:Ig-like domain-containing protein [Arthrobacter sp. SW1]
MGAGTALVAGAVLYPGFKTSEVELNDGSVWVTSKARNSAGRLNYPARMLDGAVTPASVDFDVLQQASTVFVDDRSSSNLNPVSAANMRLGGDRKLPASAKVSFGRNILAITDPAAGEVWVIPASGLGGFDPESAEPFLDSEQGVVAVVGSDDMVHTVEPASGRISSSSFDSDGMPKDTTGRTVDELKAAGELDVAAVGGQPVVLDKQSGNLFLPGGARIRLDQARDVKLQQSSGSSNYVAIATPKALIKQPLDGSTAAVVESGGEGVPAAPVQLGGCAYGAWSGSNRYVRDCANDADDQALAIPSASASPGYVFRVNRELVVLNDINSGNVWMVNRNMQLINNWDDVIPPKESSDDADKDSADEVQQTVLPDRSKPNSPPQAKPDTFGVRAGKTTVLPVLDNDSDPDGDVLTVRTPDGIRTGTLAPVYGGTGLQLAVPAGKSGSETFKYTVDDGRGGSASSDITVRVIPAGENSAPRQKPNRSVTLVLTTGKTLTQNILTDWMDPDGDDIFAVSARSSDPRDQVRIRPDGLLTFQDSGMGPGKKTLTVTVSDGTSETEGKITVDVRAAGALPPVANADHVVAVAGQNTVIAPLKNDTDPQGGSLRLAQVTPDGQSKATIGADQQTFTFNSTVTGPHYLSYLVTNGPASAQQLVRVDVVAGGTGGTPVAVRDMALLPRGGSTVVDVLGNDSDPAGGVLVVQSVSGVDGLPVAVSVLDHSVVRIRDVNATGQLTFKYTISNGKAQASGEVAVVVVPTPPKLQAPQAKADEATVRVGDVVTIPVLGNDTDPNGGRLTLDPKLAQQPDAADGKLFVSGNTLRFLAGGTAKTVYAIYKVRNESGQSDSEQVTIRIRARDDERNSRPEPKSLTARVIAGTTARIPVPLDGIDADGDSVQLTGIDKAPAAGTAVVKDGYLEYTAGADSAGTDTFSYRVRDRIGAENTGTVLVGIAPPNADNQKPLAVDDAVDVRPGRRIAVPALGNDSDPDGDPIALVTNALEAGPGLSAEAGQAGQVLVTAPSAAGTGSVGYRIQDSKKAQATAVIRVRTSPTAALHAPLAVDDHVTLAETLGKTAVDVPVLENDSDPDGVAAELKVTLPAGTENARVGADGRVVVTLAPGEQLLPYTVTDVDGQSATGIIWVPGQGLQYPTLSRTDPVEVMSGKEATVQLAEYVRVREGRKPRITVVDKVRLQGARPQNVVTNDGNAVRYAALPDYVGPGSITFEVTDGTGPEDPQGLKSTLTIMTKVVPDPNANHPPTFSGATIEVPRGDSTELELANLANDVDERDQGSLKFELAGTPPAGLGVSLNGSVLRVTADAQASSGARGAIPVKVSDGRSPAIQATITAVTVASNRRPPSANDDVVAAANAGRSETVKVLGNDVNPFEDTPLKIVSATVETGSASGQPAIAGDSVTVTPAEGFKGVLVVKYTVADKTGDPSRQASARIRLTVRAEPDAPSAPVASDVRSRTAVLKWAPPSDNGAEITSYKVQSASGFSQECATTTCTLTGLTNNVKYVFTVTAINEVGRSQPSPPSNEIRPDEKPSPPDAPAVKAGDRNMAINWTPAKTEGSPVKHYNLEISPSPANGIAVKNGVAGLSYVWPGLTNGVKYKVRAQAVNDLGPSDWSDYSAEDNPAGVPAAPAAPTSETLSADGRMNQVRAHWSEPDTNGDPIKNYYVTMSGGGKAPQTQVIPGTVRSATFGAETSETSYTFTVQAENKAGKGAVSAPSAPRRSTGKLGTVQSVRATPAATGGAGGQVRIDFQELDFGQRNGSTTSEISYTYTATTGQNGPIRPGGVVGGFSNGQQTTITVRAHSTVAPSGDASGPSSTTPYGAPGTPSASGQNGAENQKSLTLNWSSPSTSTNDVAVTKIKIDNGAWETVAASGSRTINTGGFDETHSITVQTFNSIGQGGPTASASAKSGPPPPPIREWSGVLNTNVVQRSCTYTQGGSNYRPSPYFDCDGKGGNQPPWEYPGQHMVVRCYIVQNDNWSGGPDVYWWRIEPGSARNVGRYIITGHTTMGDPGPLGAPHC